MNTNEKTAKKITAKIETLWPHERACIMQLEHEGAYWLDEGTHVALMAWDEAYDDSVPVASMEFNADLELEDLEECFAGIDAYVQDKDWEIQS